VCVHLCVPVLVCVWASASGWWVYICARVHACACMCGCTCLPACVCCMRVALLRVQTRRQPSSMHSSWSSMPGDRVLWDCAPCNLSVHFSPAHDPLLMQACAQAGRPLAHAQAHQAALDLAIAGKGARPLPLWSPSSLRHLRKWTRMWSSSSTCSHSQPGGRRRSHVKSGSSGSAAWTAWACLASMQWPRCVRACVHACGCVGVRVGLWGNEWGCG